MTVTEAMAALDAFVQARPEAEHYRTAKTLYEAALAGLVTVPLDPRLLYRWVIKWAILPEARGRAG